MHDDWRTSTLPSNVVHASKIIDTQRNGLSPREYARFRASSPSLSPLNLAAARAAVHDFIQRPPSRFDRFDLEATVLRRSAMHADITGHASKLAKELISLMNDGRIPAPHHAKIFEAMPSGPEGFKYLKNLTNRDITETTQRYTNRSPDSTFAAWIENQKCTGVGEPRPSPRSFFITSEHRGEERPVTQLETTMNGDEEKNDLDSILSGKLEPSMGVTPPIRIPNRSRHHIATQLRPRRKFVSEFARSKPVSPTPKLPSAYSLFRERQKQKEAEVRSLLAACQTVHVPIARAFAA